MRIMKVVELDLIAEKMATFLKDEILQFLLLIGAAGSGKSTVLKKWKRIFGRKRPGRTSQNASSHERPWTERMPRIDRMARGS